jgi:hypothetical protein
LFIVIEKTGGSRYLCLLFNTTTKSVPFVAQEITQIFVVTLPVSKMALILFIQIPADVLEESKLVWKIPQTSLHLRPCLQR